ncbi:putative iron-regulated protein [Roseivivax marinus]|uniref:imelysin family protein n=1 Tax=Roseivivax marinus TaxID=1379903 RepID=UPI0008D55B69|nr:imelysin family protein [Roseivivax marinus]SEL53151.1 putative iron-regulated protein [Roseivivax marinus]
MTRTLTALAALVVASPALADKAGVVTTYADIAQAGYEDSLTSAQRLQSAVEALISEPSATTHQAAKDAWLAARVPYQQTEVFRFGNPIVDDWEGKVNAWPLDEGLIDYVDDSTVMGGENRYAELNVIANESFTLSGEEVDAAEITPTLLEETLHEADGVEANVATGYHAIEFLLWGQDLNGTDHGAGERAWTDFASGEDCTNGNCDRRGAYLQAATDLLVSDLEWMAGQWAADGDARAAVTEGADAGLSAMLTGMGSLSYGEQAGERMKLGVMLNDPEEEHDCFSDNTHNSHFYDGLGIHNVYNGRYVRIDGTVVEGDSLSDLVAEADTDVDAALSEDLDHTILQMAKLKAAAEAGFSYDQMLARGNEEGEALIMASVDALVKQTRSIERAVTALGLNDIGFAGSDSLDDPNAVFQ